LLIVDNVSVKVGLYRHRFLLVNLAITRALLLLLLRQALRWHRQHLTARYH